MMSDEFREETDNKDFEPVLLVPPKLAKTSYATLLSHNYVPRKWHPEGRYGSRTPKVQDKIGIPLLRHKRKEILERINFKSQQLPHNAGGESCETDDSNSHDDTTCTRKRQRTSSSLYDLLVTPGVELIYEKPTLSNRIPRVEVFDATIHPERRPEHFHSKMCEFLKERMKRCSSQESHLNNRTASNLKNDLAAKSSSSFTFCELFAGIGGFGIALEALGGKCVFASEIYEPSRRLYHANLDTSKLPGGTIAGDIWNIDCNDIPRHDILVGGFPCQPFSTLGNQPGLGDDKKWSGRKSNIVNEDACPDDKKERGRGQLFHEIVRILKHCQPSAFLLENVPGLIGTDNGNALKTIVSALEGVGYAVTKEVCSSRGLSAQSRKRLFIVGILQTTKVNEGTKTYMDDQRPFIFPFMPDLGLRAQDVLHTEEELRDFSAASIPRELIEEFSKRDDPPSPATLFRLSDAQMSQLQTRSKTWKPAKLAWDDCTCDTIDSHYGVTIGKGNSQLVPSPAPHHPRRFTPRECARIMGFSNFFVLGNYMAKKGVGKYSTKNIERFNGFIKEQYHMLGNAVCPPVIVILAGSIISHCSDIPSKSCDEDWIDKGLWTGIELALDAVAPANIPDLLKRLQRIATNTSSD